MNPPARRPRLGVLLGDRRDLLRALRQSNGELAAIACELPSVLGDARAAAPTMLLKGHGVADRTRREHEIEAWFDRHRVEWVVAAGWSWLLTPSFLDHFGRRALNVHPTLLPSYPGRHSVERAIAAGHRPLGATVHRVDDGIDTGPPIAQAILRAEPSDARKARRLLAPLEARLLQDAIAGL